MYNLLEYYEVNGDIQWHIVDSKETIDEISEVRIEIAKTLKEAGITAYEVIAYKNIDSLRKILKREDIKVFRVEEV